MWASSSIRLPRPGRNKIRGPHGLQHSVVCGSQYNPLITDGIRELGHKFTVVAIFFSWCQLFLPELLPALTAFYHLPLLAFFVSKRSRLPQPTLSVNSFQSSFSTTGHWEPALTTHEGISWGVLLITSPDRYPWHSKTKRTEDLLVKLKSLL